MHWYTRFAYRLMWLAARLPMRVFRALLDEMHAALMSRRPERGRARRRLAAAIAAPARRIGFSNFMAATFALASQDLRQVQVPASALFHRLRSHEVTLPFRNSTLARR